jgi:catechol 2,3-dioxygenase-like lactoylglutathione lyase family enzyme
MILNDIIATLPCRDIDTTAAFYAKLGFKETGRWDDYLILRKGSYELHFAKPEPGFLKQGQNPAGIYLRVTKIDEWAAAFGAEIQLKEYGMRQFHLSDPDENLLRFGESVESN